MIEVQRVYLEGAREYAAARSGRPPWLPRLLADWEETLRAMEQRDDDWLSARLDAWIKHRLFSQALAAGGRAGAICTGRQPVRGIEPHGAKLP